LPWQKGERHFHACFCDQIMHAVGRGLLQCDTMLAHYVVMVREEVDAVLAAWTGLPAQNASPPPPPNARASRGLNLRPCCRATGWCLERPGWGRV
jgi:hypothetical protein